MLSSSQSHATITNYCRNGKTETTVRQRPRSSRTNEINNRDQKSGDGFIWSRVGGRAGSVAATGGDSAGVSRDGCPRHSGGGVERDPLVGLMLAGQQSRPHPGSTVRRRRGNGF